MQATYAQTDRGEQQLTYRKVLSFEAGPHHEHVIQVHTSPVTLVVCTAALK